MNTCLVIIFNHRFDANLAILRKIYGERFSVIRFLMPFYDGKDNDVIPVYECSYQFQGYLIQAYEKLSALKSDYYLFIGDDVMLNPEINERNCQEKLGAEKADAAIMGMYPLNMPGKLAWPHCRFSSRPFFKKSTSWKESLTDYSEAMARMERYFGKPYPEVYGENFFEGFLDLKEEFRQRNGGAFTIPYPMAHGYSDVFILRRSVLYPFSRTCGIFAAMNVFVEIAIPTAMILVCENIANIDEADRQCITAWESEREALRQHYQSITELMKKWKDEVLFIHPVKLSEWVY